jgi:hypothetical protein
MTAWFPHKRRAQMIQVFQSVPAPRQDAITRQFRITTGDHSKRFTFGMGINGGDF